jgi:hypothetical protein
MDCRVKNPAMTAETEAPLFHIHSTEISLSVVDLKLFPLLPRDWDTNEMPVMSLDPHRTLSFPGAHSRTRHRMNIPLVGVEFR